MDEILIRQPDSAPHENLGSAAVRAALEAVIESNEDKELAGMAKSDLDVKIALIEKEFDGTDDNPGPVSLAYRTWKSGVALRDKALKGFKDAKKILIDKAAQYDYAVEKRRLEESRKAADEARKKAEQDREQEIKEAKKLGDREAVAALKEAPIIPVITVAPATPAVTKVDGLRKSSPQWDWEMVSEAKIPKKYWCVDTDSIDDVVKKLGPKADIPGINIFDKRSRGGV